MLTLIAGGPQELEELVRDYRELGVPADQIRRATYASIQDVPPDDLQDDTIIFELSMIQPGSWHVATKLRNLAANADFKLLYRGTPSAAVEGQLQEGATAMCADGLIIVSASNETTKRRRLRESASHLVSDMTT